MAGATAKDIIALRYRLVHELGKGGMGTVWKAHDDRLNRDVALKLMAKRLLADKTAVDRFEREAKAVARLLSPHIVQIYDYGIDPQPFMVMELLEGENVSQRLTREERIPLDEVAMIMRQAANGLATAHEAGIVHRDLKPGNLFIVRDRDSEFVKVVDFGIAKGVRREVTLTAITSHNQPVGTPQYMSPDQLRAKEDHRDDVWSLAVIAYKALCGVHPFASDSLVTLVQRILDDPHEAITVHEPALPAGIDAVFERAFAKDREERFQSAPDFAEALDELLTEAPFALPARAMSAAPEPTPDVGDSHPSRPSHPPRPSHPGRRSSPPRRSSLPPPVFHADEESTAEMTLVRARPAAVVGEDEHPTLVADSMPTAVLDAASWPPRDAVPTPTPPPGGVTPWPVVGVPRRGPALGPLIVGVSLSVATVVILVWFYLPHTGSEVETTLVPQATLIESPTVEARPPAPETSAASIAPPPSATGSATLPANSAHRAPPAPVSAPEPPAPAPAAGKTVRTKGKKKKKGDEAFESGPF